MVGVVIVREMEWVLVGVGVGVLNKLSLIAVCAGEVEVPAVQADNANMSSKLIE